MTRLGDNVVGQYDRVRAVQAAFKCDECRHISIAIAPYPTSGGAGIPQGYLESNIKTWLPLSGAGNDYPDVPPHIAAAASEAHLCFSVNAHRAAVLLARSVIEASAKEKEITSGRLVDKIDKMHEQGLIRLPVKEGAHEVRYLGNDMAHGDFVEPVEAEEAEEVLALMAEVLHDVFQQDARVARLREARKARKAKS